MSTKLSRDVQEVKWELERVRKSQLANTSSIIASQERIADRIDMRFGEINTTLIEMGSMIDWHMANITWILEQQNGYLNQILETLQAPLDTAAKELRKRAEIAFANGWYEEALNDFLQSERVNPYDFSVCHNLGLIFLELGQLDNALVYFLKAAKYAKPTSTLHASYSKIFVARVYRLLGKPSLGLHATEEAIQLSPQFPEAWYQHAVSWAAQGNIKKSLMAIETATWLDRYYILKPRIDDEMRDVVPYLPELEEALRAEAQINAQRSIDIASKSFSLTGAKEIKPLIKQAKIYYARNSYFDYLDARQLAIEAVNGAEVYLNMQLSRVGSGKTAIKNAFLGNSLKMVAMSLGVILIGLLVGKNDIINTGIIFVIGILAFWVIFLVLSKLSEKIFYRTLS